MPAPVPARPDTGAWTEREALVLDLMLSALYNGVPVVTYEELSHATQVPSIAALHKVMRRLAKKLHAKPYRLHAAYGEGYIISRRVV